MEGSRYSVPHAASVSSTKAISPCPHQNASFVPDSLPLETPSRIPRLRCWPTTVSFYLSRVPSCPGAEAARVRDRLRCSTGCVTVWDLLVAVEALLGKTMATQKAFSERLRFFISASACIDPKPKKREENENT